MTENGPAPATVPGVTVPSPQSIPAVKSPATLAKESLKLATTALVTVVVPLWTNTPEALMESTSGTVAVSVAVAVPLPGGLSLMVTVTVKVPSSA